MHRFPVQLTLFVALAWGAPLAEGQDLGDGPESHLRDSRRLHLELPSPAEALPSGFSIEVPLDGGWHTLELDRHSLRRPGAELLLEGTGGEFASHDLPAARTYRGGLSGDPASSVAASFVGEELQALVWTSAGTWGLQPTGDGDYLWYAAEDVMDTPALCGVQAAGLSPSIFRPSAGAGGGFLLGQSVQLAEIAFDADRRFFERNDSDLGLTVADIENVLNQVDLIYTRDASVTLGLTSIVIRTGDDDPYTTNDSGDLLEQFADEWEASFGFVQRDIAHLMTGRNLQGETVGVAYLATVCDEDFSYGLSQSFFMPLLTTRVALTAHELGHNFGANHCDGAMPCRIMCASLGGCSGNLGSFSASTVNMIQDFVGDIDCLVPEPAALALPFFDGFNSSSIDRQRWPLVQGGVTSTAGLGEPSGGRSLNLDSFPLDGPNGADRIVSAAMLLGNAEGQYLRFYSQHRGVEAGESLLAEVLLEDGTWMVLEELVSDGVDQTAFDLHELPLPAQAYHDEFRCRFRTTVSDTGDDWFLDDVAVDDQPQCPLPSNYCTGAANSFSPFGAIILSQGSTSLEDNDFALLVLDAATNQPGIFYYGSEPLSLPFGNGFRCVGGFTTRLPLVQTGPLGAASFPLDFTSLPPTGAIAAGDTDYFQFWYRDPKAGGANFNLSDGLSITWCP